MDLEWIQHLHGEADVSSPCPVPPRIDKVSHLLYLSSILRVLVISKGTSKPITSNFIWALEKNE